MASTIPRSSPKFGRVVGLDRAVRALFRAKHNRFMAGFLDRCDHLFPAGLGQVRGKKTAITDDHSKGH
jgi:hypothetical protein